MDDLMNYTIPCNYSTKNLYIACGAISLYIQNHKEVRLCSGILDVFSTFPKLQYCESNSLEEVLYIGVLYLFPSFQNIVSFLDRKKKLSLSCNFRSVQLIDYQLFMLNDMGL